MYEVRATLLYLQTVQTFQYPGALRSAQAHPHALVLPRVGGVGHGGWRLRPFGHLTGCAASSRCWFVMVGADHSCRPFQGHNHPIPAHPQPPFLHGWAGSTSLCLPRGVAVAASPFELENGSDANCSLDIKIAGTCFSHAGLGWAGPGASPGWPGRVVWWGLLGLSQVEQPGCGEEHGQTLGRAAPGLCKVHKTPCVTLWSQVFLSPQPHALLFDLVYFSPHSAFNQIYSLAVFDQGRTV